MHDLQQLLDLEYPPLALSFRAEAPAGVPRVPPGTPAGCGYWRRAQAGEVFYTTAEDHYGCPVGAHTHGIDLPAPEAEALQGLVQVMVGLEYLRPEEIPALPRRPEPFGVAVYAPLGSEPTEADLVLVRGTARQVMLLAEAAAAAGCAGETAPMGRPACALVPHTLASGSSALSLGCIGNRVYTGLAEGELYYSLPGAALPAVAERLAVLVRANRELESFHRGRAAG